MSSLDPWVLDKLRDEYYHSVAYRIYNIVNNNIAKDGTVEYPDNTQDGAPDEFYTNQDAMDKLFQPAPTPSEAKLEDIVREPGHYKIFPDMEVIDIIRKCLTKEEFMGYCKGNIIKYRLRDKHDNAEDFAKSKEYQKYMQSTETI